MSILTVAFACTILPLRSALVINLVESGSDVVATLSGSINSLDGAIVSQTGASAVNFNALRPTDALFGFNAGSSSSLYNNYSVSTYPSNFGTLNTFSPATSSTANVDMFFRSSQSSQVWIGQAYTLGSPVTGTLTWADKSFATLGVDEGTYLWSWTGDSITLNIGGGPGPEPVPEPGTWVAAALLATGATLMRLRRRAKAS